jgi:predicted lipoprotein with Yx(FWY)xxD motif
MRRLSIAVILAAMGLLVGVAIAASSTTVKLESTAAGKILATSSRYTLYMFTADGRNRDVCAKRSGCLTVWPPLTTKAKPVAGPGVNPKLLGTIKLGKREQVTYDGHPLYTYFEDGPGITSYVGVRQFGGAWFALTATGKIIKQDGAPAT